MVFNAILSIIACAAGAVAAVSGFGIGSLLTPAMALETGTKIAVAAVSIPHLFGTAVRFWMMRDKVDRNLFWSFGIASAVFGLLGALISVYASNKALSWVFGALLILSGLGTLTGFMEKLHPGRRTAWIAAALSGLLGGLVGNQGGIRTAALLGFNVPRDAFVATATAVGLMVDFGRMPVYLITGWTDIARHWPAILMMSAGVLVGTVIGVRTLSHIPENVFRRIVAVLVILLGMYMIFRDWNGGG